MLYFGNTKFTLNITGRNYVTDYGMVSLEDIEAAVVYFTFSPKLCGYDATIHVSNGNYAKISESNDKFKIGFGCAYGTLEELIELRDFLAKQLKLTYGK